MELPMRSVELSDQAHSCILYSNIEDLKANYSSSSYDRIIFLTNVKSIANPISSDSESYALQVIATETNNMFWRSCYREACAS